MRTVATENSTWEFDTENNLYRRYSNGHHPESSNAIPYTGEWEPYEELLEPDEHQFGGPRLLVVRPVPMGTGRLRLTGYIVSDDKEKHEQNDD